MRRNILIATIALLAGPVVAPAASAEEEIRSAEKNWATAVMAGNYAAVEQILADRLIYAHSTGVIESKHEYMARLRSGAQKYESIVHQKVVVQVYGDAAVAHSRVRMTGKSNERPFADQLMMLHLWVKQGSKWRLAAHQTTKLP